MEKRRTGDQHCVGLSPRQCLLKAFKECSMLLARRTARGLQCFLIYVHTGNRREVGVLSDKVEPMTTPASDSNMDDFYSHLLSLLCFLICSTIRDRKHRSVRVRDKAEVQPLIDVPKELISTERFLPLQPPFHERNTEAKFRR